MTSNERANIIRPSLQRHDKNQKILQLVYELPMHKLFESVNHNGHLTNLEQIELHDKLTEIQELIKEG